jgi:hypothetical protein
MTRPDGGDRPHWHAELVRLEAELRQLRIAIAWAERSGEPRRAATLRREESRRRRRIAHLRDLLGLVALNEEE